ncbi:MAG: hypothetical protein Q8O55_02175 [Dehalococcoidales bacterium]|nr:hypothetical protein [Dehalococcoidales bacterium]
MKIRRIEKVLLYDESSTEALNITEVARYLREKLNTQVEVRGNPFPAHLEKDPDFAGKLAAIKIQDARSKIAPDQEPLYAETRYEQRKLLGKTSSFGVLYEGFRLHRLFSEPIAEEERFFTFAHILFSNRLFGTWDEGDGRYHIRTSLYGLPSVISTTGLVEAPARPREYYLLKQQYEALGKDPLEVKESFKGRFIDYDDGRLTEVIKGYVMQAVFYCLTGDPFCKDKGCRLYNAHWQEELIFAQLESEYEFCQRHSRILASL